MLGVQHGCMVRMCVIQHAPGWCASLCPHTHHLTAGLLSSSRLPPPPPLQAHLSSLGGLRLASLLHLLSRDAVPARHLDATAGLLLAFLQAAMQQGPEPGDSGAYYRCLLWLQDLCVQRLNRDPAELWLQQGQAVLGLPQFLVQAAAACSKPVLQLCRKWWEGRERQRRGEVRVVVPQAIPPALHELLGVLLLLDDLSGRWQLSMQDVYSMQLCEMLEGVAEMPLPQGAADRLAYCCLQLMTAAVRGGDGDSGADLRHAVQYGPMVADDLKVGELAVCEWCGWCSAGRGRAGQSVLACWQVHQLLQHMQACEGQSRQLVCGYAAPLHQPLWPCWIGQEGACGTFSTRQPSAQCMHVQWGPGLGKAGGALAGITQLMALPCLAPQRLAPVY